jgi:hypothetical protein
MSDPTDSDNSAALSGRELDFAVAPIMGWELKPDGQHWSHQGTRQWHVDALFVPHYSTSIKAAWGLVEQLGMLVSPTLVGGWGAGVFKGTQGITDSGMRYCEPGTWGEAETAPIAICRAALRSLRSGFIKLPPTIRWIMP